LTQRRTLLKSAAATLAAAAVGHATPVRANNWTLEQAARPFAGQTVNLIMLDRPGYRAIQRLIPEFEERTGIRVRFETVTYETAHDKQTIDFNGRRSLTAALVDVVWIGEFVEKGWIVPVDRFTADPAIADPALNLEGFFPLLLNSFGTWGGRTYGLPFDNYSGLLFFNREHLREAGFDRPPETWAELKDVYAPRLTDRSRRRFGYALQSLRGETQSCDAFMRFLWPFGGSLLDERFRSNLTSPGSIAGLSFRQELMPFMPPGVAGFDHNETVAAFASGRVSMITQWSAFHGTLSNPAESRVAPMLGIAAEPMGPAGRLPALGGFSLAVAAQAPEAAQKAAWLFIQWATSEALATRYLEGGGVPGRQAVYQRPEIRERFSFVVPMVESWKQGAPAFRPRFAAWTKLSPIVSDWGARIQTRQVTPAEGLRELGTQMEALLAAEGYYDGRKPLLQ
jgi:multiple sugar transport system substrate-binding protein